MSILSNKLEKSLSETLQYPCKVWFDRRYGWLFTTDRTCEQRIGWTYNEAFKFVQPHKSWEWLRDALNKSK